MATPAAAVMVCLALWAGAAVLLVLFIRRLVSLWREFASPAVVRRELLTSAERRFLHVLQDALPRRIILAQVSMAALLKPRSGLDRASWWRVYGRFSQKIVDFCVVDAKGQVLAVVELDDPSHRDRAADDAARDRLLARGGYTVHRFATHPWPGVAAVRDRLGHLETNRRAA